MAKSFLLAIFLVASFASAASDLIDLELILQQWGIQKCGENNFDYSTTGVQDKDELKCENGQWNPSGSGSHPLCMGQKSYTASEIRWGEHTSTEDQPTVLYSKCYENQNDQELKEHFDRTEKYTDEFHTTTTTSVKGTVSMTISAGIPEFVKIEETISLEVSTTEEDGKTTTKEIDVSDSQDVTVSPYSNVQVDQLILTSKFNAKYQVDVQFVGAGAVKCKDKVDDHYIWYPFASELLQSAGKNCEIDGNGEDTKCTLDGLFEGVAGTKHHVKVEKVDQCNNFDEKTIFAPRNATRRVSNKKF